MVTLHNDFGEHRRILGDLLKLQDESSVKLEENLLKVETLVQTLYSKLQNLENMIEHFTICDQDKVDNLQRIVTFNEKKVKDFIIQHSTLSRSLSLKVNQLNLKISMLERSNCRTH